ncbi:MAG: hypothetical protein NTZ77_01430 [Caldiserica bacterium]|nr:hypothetical protein [Caldisericota bacterium]
MNRPRAGVVLVRIARILMIAFILFLTMFSLDVFEIEATLLEQLGGFVMHSIPSLVLVAVLLVSWRNPLLGGILTLASAAALVLRFRIQAITELATLVLPLITVGTLFIAAYLASRKGISGSPS